MDILRNITINLSKEDISQMIVDYLEKEGYQVTTKDIVFSVGTRIEGYGLTEHPVSYFDGCKVHIKDK